MGSLVLSPRWEGCRTGQSGFLLTGEQHADAITLRRALVSS
jgi:hypothetical protein